MKRTINSTGRKKVPQDAIVIRLTEPSDGAPRTFTAHFPGIATLGLSPDARIYVEPYVAQSSMRFPFGSVAVPESPEDTSLREVDDGPVLFRVKIVDETGGTGRILAAANEISSRGRDDDESRKSLLPIRRTDLGEELWKLHIRRDHGPELCINNRVPGLADRVPVDPLLQGMILPIVLRRIVPVLLDTDDEAPWQDDWKAWGSRLVGEPIEWEIDVEDEEAVEEIVDRLSHAFLARQRYATRVREQQEEYQNG
jgi:hypothetical protein